MRGTVPTDYFLATQACVYQYTYEKEEDKDFWWSLFLKRYSSPHVSKLKLQGFIKFAQGVGPKKREQVAMGYDLPELEKFSKEQEYYDLSEEQKAGLRKVEEDAKLLSQQLNKFVRMKL